MRSALSTAVWGVAGAYLSLCLFEKPAECADLMVWEAANGLHMASARLGLWNALRGVEQKRA